MAVVGADDICSVFETHNTWFTLWQQVEVKW